MTKLAKRIIIIAPIAALVIVIVGFIIKFFLEQPRYITNLNEIKTSLAPAEWQGIEDSILGYVNFVADTDIKVSTMAINPETYEETTSYGPLVVNFVVNLDELERSYAITYKVINRPSEESETIVNCPLYKYNKYPGTNCVGMNNDSNTISLYLPLTFMVDEHVATLTAGYDGGLETVVVEIENCGDHSLMSSALAQAKISIEEFGLDPNNYRFVVPLNYNKCLVR